MKIASLLFSLLFLASCVAEKPKTMLFYDQKTNPIVPIKEANRKSPSSINCPDKNIAFKDRSNTITKFELGVLMCQISKCWAKEAQKVSEVNAITEVRIKVSPERKILSSELVNSKKLQQQPYYWLSADTALRALRSQSCSVLDLNPHKHDLWKDMIVTFAPEELK